MHDAKSHYLTLLDQPLEALSPEPVRLPLISFVLRNWNYAGYVGCAIDSIRAQDYPRFEAIVVDNGSTDESREVIDRHVDSDPRFQVVHTDENLGPMGGVIRGLDAANGTFVAFVDSDDYLMPSFASAHVQVHLALARNVALTSSNVIEIGADGAVLAGGKADFVPNASHSDVVGLRAAFAVPRLSSISDEMYARLSEATIAFVPWRDGWLWGNGSSHMFRKFVLEMIRPLCGKDTMARLAADSFFTGLAHVIGGTAQINLPLSACRIHDKNFFAASSSLSHFDYGTGTAAAYFEVRRRESARAVLDRAETFNQRTRGRLWNALDRSLTADGGDLRQQISTPEMRTILARNLSALFTCFGPSTALRELRNRMGYAALYATMKEAYGGHVPGALRRKLLRLEIRRALRKKR